MRHPNDQGLVEAVRKPDGTIRTMIPWPWWRLNDAGRLEAVFNPREHSPPKDADIMVLVDTEGDGCILGGCYVDDFRFSSRKSDDGIWYFDMIHGAWTMQRLAAVCAGCRQPIEAGAMYIEPEGAFYHPACQP